MCDVDRRKEGGRRSPRADLACWSVRIVLLTLIGVVVFGGIVASISYTWRQGIWSMRLLKARFYAAWKERRQQ
ncbi:hypothetical protein BJY01DRAFT_12489 [Aspergillus pseudoustus]|uniref:Uncharacterized protein n=1 Tax=Aspergillus pseudoustus TaxID=1810923 RepID=A0ABR4JMY5_9EURO